MRHIFPQQKTWIPLLALLVAGGLGSCHGQVETLPTRAFELPEYGQQEDIVSHVGYTASYNHTTLCPDWVAWELTAEEVGGNAGGKYSFSWDPAVDFPKASREDYARSGYDKGHMAPRADMRWSEQALEESYYFSNVCPQDHELNSGVWRKIEELTRRMARHYGRAWVVCGPVYDSVGGRRIGEAGVHVPDRFFKAIVVKEGETYHAIGFLVDNSPQTGAPQSYAVSVDSVEAAIGRDLFPGLPEDVEATFEWRPWNK